MRLKGIEVAEKSEEFKSNQTVVELIGINKEMEFAITCSVKELPVFFKYY